MLNMGYIVFLITQNYLTAQKNNDIRKPWSWALHQTWKVIDSLEQEKENDEVQNV